MSNVALRVASAPPERAQSLFARHPQRIPGRVSGIFLHVTDGSPTWGCVAIGREEMRSVLNWLDPSASPRITIGVGTPSLAASGS
jgi:hypothetical protein